MAEKTVSVRLTARIDAYKKAMADARASTDKLGQGGAKSMEQLGAKFQSVGRGLTRSVTLPLVAIGGAAVKMGADFDSSMTKIQTLVGISADEVDGMRDSVMGLSGQTARSPQELADALFVVTSAGLRGEDAMSALEMAAKASAIGMGETKDIARAVASAVNAYGSDVLSAADATDILTATARAGNFETSELAGALGRVLPFAKQAGASFEDVGGAIALLTRSGLSASESVTQLTALFRGMVAPSQQTITELAKVGLTAGDVRDAIAEDGLVGAMHMLDEAAGGNSETFNRLVGGSEAASAAIQILGADAETVASTFGLTAEAANMTQESFEQWSESASAKMSQAFNEIKVALTDLGSALLPVVADIASGIAGLVSGFSDLSPAAQGVIIAIGGIAAVAGPLLMIFGSIIRNVQTLATAMSALRVAMAAHPLLAIAGIAATVVGAYAMMSDAVNSHADAHKRLNDEIDEFAQQAQSLGGPLAALQAEIDSIVLGNEDFRISMQWAGLDVGNLVAAITGGKQPAQDFERELVRGAIAAGATREQAQELGLIVYDLQQRYAGAEEALAQYDDVQGDASEGAAEYGPHLDEVATATKDVGAKSETTTGTIGDLVSAFEEAKAAADALYDSTLSLIDSDYAYRGAVDGVNDGLFELYIASQDGATSQAELDDMVYQLEGSMLDQAAAAVRLAEDTAEAGGETLTAKEKTQIYRDELVRLRDSVGADSPLGRALSEHINTIDSIPEDADTTVTLSGTAEAEVLAARIRDAIYSIPTNRYITITTRYVQETGYPVPSLPGGAMGGYFDKPTNMLIGEDGPEVLLPLSKPQRMTELLSDPSVAAKVASALSISGAGAVGGSSASRPTAVRLPAVIDLSVQDATTKLKKFDSSYEGLLAALERRDADLAINETLADFFAKMKEANKIARDSESTTKDIAAAQEDVREAFIDSSRAVAQYAYDILGLPDDVVIDLVMAWERGEFEYVRKEIERLGDVADTTAKAIDEIGEALEAAFGDLDIQEAVLSLRDQFRSLDDAASRVFDENTIENQDAYRKTLIATAREVAAFASEVLGLPDEAIIELIAAINAGEVDSVRAFLDMAAAGTEIPLDLNDDGMITEVERRLQALGDKVISVPIRLIDVNSPGTPVGHGGALDAPSLQYSQPVSQTTTITNVYQSSSSPQIDPEAVARDMAKEFARTLQHESRAS